MSGRVSEVKIIGGDYLSKTEFIPRITISSTKGDANFSFKLKRPSRVLDIINKAQGQSVKRVGIEILTSECRFSLKDNYTWYFPGQQAAEMSRSFSDQGGTRTTNVVCPEVLTGEARSLLEVVRSLCSHSRLH